MVNVMLVNYKLDYHAAINLAKSLLYSINGGVDEMKSSACRVQIAFKEDVQPEIFDCIKLRNFSQNGRVFSFIALGDEEEIREKLNNLNPVFMDILPLTLEEAFTYRLESHGVNTLSEGATGGGKNEK